MEGAAARGAKPGFLRWLRGLRVRPGLWELMLDSAVQCREDGWVAGAAPGIRRLLVQYFKIKF